MTAWTHGPAKALVLIGAFLTAGCVSTPQGAALICDGETWRETKLFFGRDVPTGGSVTEPQWRAFLRSEVVPRFKAGFTVLDGAGFWLDTETSETGGEESKVLIVFHQGEPDVQHALNETASAYIRQFDQQAVLSTTQAACVTFHGDDGAGD